MSKPNKLIALFFGAVTMAIFLGVSIASNNIFPIVTSSVAVVGFSFSFMLELEMKEEA